MYRSWIISRISFDHKNLGPFRKNLNLPSIFLHVPSQKCSTCTICILLNFHHFWVFLDFLESSRCLLNIPFGFIFIEVSMLMNTSLQKVDFLLTFKRTCNVLIHNFRMKHFLPNLVRHEVVENWIPLKMRFAGIFFDKLCQSYVWSKFCWLLVQKT